MNAHPALTARQHPVVQVSNLVRSFGRGPNILNGLDLTIRAGEFVALLGRSGSGKSTLLRTLAGLDEAAARTVTVPAERAVVFQEPRLIPWKRVWANVALGLRRSDARERAALARALVREPKLLLLDEPFAALDALTRLKTQGLVASLWRAHRPAVLLVTHDVDEALLLADRVLVLDQGRIGFDLHVNLERPRRHSHPAFSSLRLRLLRELGVEDENADASLDELAVGWNASARTKAPAASG